MSDEEAIRTALYVQEPSTITIVAKDPRDANAQLYRYNQPAIQRAVGTHRLEPGIYLLLSLAEMSIMNHSVMTVVMPRGKDGWPDLTAAVVALEAGATAESIQAFFRVAKHLPESSPADPAEPGAATDPDDLHD